MYLQSLVRSIRLPLRRQFIRNYDVPINEVKRGLIISHKSKLWVVGDTTHHTQGRRGSHYNLDLKDLQSGKYITERFNAGSSVQGVQLEAKKYHFLYISDDVLHLIDPESYEEQSVSLDLLPGGKKTARFLQEDMPLKVSFHQNRPITVSIPETSLVFKVAETAAPPSSSTNESQKGVVFKPAILSNGVQINVPDFVYNDDEILVDILEAKYLKKIK